MKEDNPANPVDGVQDAMHHACEIDLMEPSRFDSLDRPVTADDHGSVSRMLTMAENSTHEDFTDALARTRSVAESQGCPVVGVTGTGGAERRKRSFAKYEDAEHEEVRSKGAVC